MGELPNDWEPITVGTLIDQNALFVKNGFPQGKHNTSGVGVPHLRPFNVSEEGNIDLSQIKYVPPPEKDGPYWVRRRDVIFNNTNSEELVGKTALFEMEGEFVLSNHMTIVRVIDDDLLDPFWLSMAFLYLWRQRVFKAMCRRHVNQASVSLQRIKNLELLLPPLPEQRAIAQVLRTVQRARQATQKVIAAARQLKASLSKHLFTYGPVPIDQAERVELKGTETGPMPRYWETIKLGDIARIGNGSTPKRTNRSYWEGGTIPWLTSGKVYEGIIRRADEFVTEQAQTECHLPLVRKNSVVVAITGQGKTLGHAALVSFDTCVSQHLAYVQFHSNGVVPAYVLSYLQSRYAHLRQISSAGGSTKGALTCGFLKGYPVPLPPLDEQRSIVRALEAIDSKLKAEMRREKALDALFQTLLHDLMTGRLRVNRLNLAEPDPASEELPALRLMHPIARYRV